MFGLGPAAKIYISLDAVDMRKGFDGLYGLVRDHLGQDPQSGHLFLFTNRSRTRLKVLVCDGILDALRMRELSRRQPTIHAALHRMARRYSTSA